MPPIPPMENVKESELPKINATKMAHVATTCSNPPN